MTGYGEAARQDEHLAATVEVRAINNRYLKVVARCGDGFPTLESQIEPVVRRHIKRGTVQVQVRIQRPSPTEGFRINEEVLEGYRRQLEQIQQHWQRTEPVPLDALLELPGVVDEQPLTGDAAQVWSLVEPTLTTALENLNAMRRAEGESMASDLSGNVEVIEDQLAKLETRAPQVLAAYRQRLCERIQQWLQENQVAADTVDLIREVGLFADRCDISEECVRLHSHLDQFRQTLQQAEASGRRLDFLTQEMFRETNTIGSKANDAQISQHVVEIKTAIERIREMVQNVE